MVLLIHVGIALISVGITTFVCLWPTQTRLRISYGLVAATLASGTYVVVSSGAAILQACLSGLFYLGLVSVGLVTAHHSLVKQERTHD